ncbi:MAG: hypothetical protein JNM88_12885 [Chitinophagaceae bacterium]|nr:hypothetical protein [Chitinophagaceae bacterium]
MKTSFHTRNVSHCLRLPAIRILGFLLLLLITQQSIAQRKDTLYYNSRWQICEKPFASYYRFGRIVIDTFWFYQGRVYDYYMDDKLQMDGNYSSIGEKDGAFWFFYPDGSPQAQGLYIANQQAGIWEYYHPNNKGLKLRVDFAGDGFNFVVHDYIDSTGKVLLKDSTGEFVMDMSVANTQQHIRLEGEFSKGKKTGSWKYLTYVSSIKKYDLVIKEQFENGVLKKGTTYLPDNIVWDTYKASERHDQFTPWQFTKFRATEFFQKDRTTFRHTNDDEDLLEYLVNRQAPTFDVEDSTFEASFMGVLSSLNTPSILKYFNDPDKLYNGYVELNLSDSGDIEELEINGNLSPKEKEYMDFFFRKFKNIKEIVVDNVGIDAYHKIYFYTVLFADLVPKKHLYLFPEKMFMFFPVPFDKLKELLHEKSKKKKK